VSDQTDENLYASEYTSPDWPVTAPVGFRQITRENTITLAKACIAAAATNAFSYEEKEFLIEMGGFIATTCPVVIAEDESDTLKPDPGS